MYCTGKMLCLGGLFGIFRPKIQFVKVEKKRNKFLITSQNITQMHIIIDRHKTQRFCLTQFPMLLVFCLISNFI